jgi:hypothetical protein
MPRSGQTGGEVEGHALALVVILATSSPGPCGTTLPIKGRDGRFTPPRSSSKPNGLR